MNKKLKLTPTTDNTLHVDASALSFPTALGGYDIQCGACEEIMLKGYDVRASSFMVIDALVCQHCGQNNLFASVLPQS